MAEELRKGNIIDALNEILGRIRAIESVCGALLNRLEPTDTGRANFIRLFGEFEISSKDSDSSETKGAVESFSSGFADSLNQIEKGLSSLNEDEIRDDYLFRA